MSLEESLVLGRYRVLLPLDERKLVKAYLARDEQGDGSDTPILIKHFLLDLSSRRSSTEVSRLLEELGALEQLEMPGVVRLLGHGIVDGRLLTAQALLPGIGLLALSELFEQRRAPFPRHLAVYIVRRLLLTLEGCHTHPKRAFVHGRINLGCIHLPRGGEPQLSDFCLTKLADDAAEAESVLGFFLMRISYVAPEVPRNGRATPQNDTYSLGLILYRLLSGKNPFRGRTAGETLQRVLKQPPAPLEVPGWEHCEQANEILMRALAKDPERRYQSCQVLYDALGALQVGSDESLAAELSRVIADNGSDWGRVTLLPDSVRRTRPRRSLPAERLPLARYFESAKPAFASGLTSEQPRSVSQHTRRDEQERSERKLRPLGLIAGVMAAAAVTLAIFLFGDLGAAGGQGGEAPMAAARAEPGPKAAVIEASTRLRGCGDRFGRSIAVKAALEFDELGQLTAVRLLPPELTNTQLGACLVSAVWAANTTVPGTKSLVMELDF
jgi:serine/threonine protein kinase